MESQEYFMELQEGSLFAKKRDVFYNFLILNNSKISY